MAEMTTAACAIECRGKSIREINQEIKARAAAGEPSIELLDPDARHNLGVGLIKSTRLHIKGSAGYFCAGLIDGPHVEVDGSAGWGLAESMMNGTVVVRGNAGNGAGAAIRGGNVIIHGDAAARLGVSIKGGLVLVGGNCGYMAGFMAQKGTILVCGDAGEAFADSMYGATCYVGGHIAELGTDAVASPVTEEEAAWIEQTLTTHFTPEERSSKPPAGVFKKVVAGRKLWSFDKKNWAWWQEAL